MTDSIFSPKIWICAHASYREGLPRAVVQGMLSGLPVIAYALDGAPEVIEDGVTGFLVDAGDTQTFADHICKLASDKDLAGRMGAEGRRRVRSEFSWHTMVDRIIALYDSLLTKNQGNPSLDP